MYVQSLSIYVPNYAIKKRISTKNVRKVSAMKKNCLKRNVFVLEMVLLKPLPYIVRNIRLKKYVEVSVSIKIINAGHR